MLPTKVIKPSAILKSPSPPPPPPSSTNKAVPKQVSNVRFHRYKHYLLEPRGVLPYQEVGGLAPKFASEILVGAPNFASKNLSDKYPKFCPLNFRFDPKIGIFPQLLRLVITEVPKFYLVNLAGPCPKFCL